VRQNVATARKVRTPSRERIPRREAPGKFLP